MDSWRSIGGRTKSRFALIAFALFATPLGWAAGDPANLSGGGTNCSKIDTIKVHAFPTTILNIVSDVMEAQGFYRKNCLAAERVLLQTAPIAFAASVNGDVNFMNLAIDNGLVARTNGLKVKIVAAMFSRPILALVISKALALPHLSEGYPAIMKDLVGKKIGVTAIGTSTSAAAQANFLAAGLKADSATYIGIGGTPAMLAALANHSVDAVQMYGEGQDVAEAMGLGIVVGDLRQSGGNVAPVIEALTGTSVVWWAQQSYIDGHRDIVRRFSKANSEAIAWIKNPANFETLVALMDKMEPLAPSLPDKNAVNRKRVRIFANNVSDKIDTKALDGWNKFAIYAGEIKQALPLNEVVWKE